MQNYTTCNVIPDNYSISHPSIFQNPLKDKQIMSDLNTAKATTPGEMWSNQINAREAEQYPYDASDPPFTTQEIENIKMILKPAMNVTLSSVMPSLLFFYFFSANNISNIQLKLRYAVNKWSGYHVGEQSLTELMVIMENIFTSKARHLNEGRTSSQMLLRYIRTEVERLNELVINEACPIIINGIEQHVNFMKKMDSPLSAAGLQRPMNTKVTGMMEYRSTNDILSL